MRYFRASLAVYASICEQLDAAYGYPNEATKTYRALPLASELPSDPQGRVYLAVSDDQCQYILPSEMLPELLASGAVDEVTETTYRALLPVL